MKKSSAACVLLLAVTALTFAQGMETSTSLAISGYYELPNHEGFGTSGFAPVDFSVVEKSGPAERDLGSGWGSAGIKAAITRALVIPVLRDENELFKDNHLTLEATGELSPVSLNATVEVTLVPIAFFKVSVGAGAGTGWTAGFIGLAINPPSNTLDIEEKPFGGIVWRTWASGTLQFDLAAVVPGDWNHVVAAFVPTVEYKAFTGADDDTAWVWEADSGRNFNGFRLKMTAVLGYRPPVLFDTVGILLETEEWLGSVRERSSQDSAGGWGSDFREVSFGPIVVIAPDKTSSITLGLLFFSGIKWTDATTKNRYFENRDFEGTYLAFGRLIVSYGLTL